jgi:hypothetical protein
MTNAMMEPADAIRGLIEERERYEAWLTALEARRGSTPTHVFERVRTDYDGRLRGVRDRLAEAIIPLQERETTLAQRSEEVTRALAERQDQLAELELRTLVGEFDAEDGERRVQEAASKVRELDGERRSVTEQLGELRALIRRAGAESTVPTPAPTEPAPVAESQGAPTEDGATDVAATAVAATPPATPGVATAAVERRSPTPSWQHAAAGAGDDEAFVGTGHRLDSLAASLGGAVAPPPATAAGGQERTLRCQDCGEMNYPTEWYCERCGGELAAL